ncbi:hypothetical protein K488DRAFT_20409, partial [Vararia minispora EC-137]
VACAAAEPILFDGRLPRGYTLRDLDASIGPYLSVVKGAQNASHAPYSLTPTQYTTLSPLPPTPLWPAVSPDIPIALTIDNTSIFTPGGSAPQLGFRRTDLIAQPSAPGANRTAFNDGMLDAGLTAFHFSVRADEANPLNFTHEYQAVWIEPDDGSHVFDLQIGTPFNTTLASPNTLRIRTHNGTPLFSTSFSPRTWHNFAVAVDWPAQTLQTFYSRDAAPLQRVTPVIQNAGALAGSEGQGDFHVALLKLPLIDSADTPAEQADVVHFGIQEGGTEGIVFSGVFVERLRGRGELSRGL